MKNNAFFYCRWPANIVNHSLFINLLLWYKWTIRVTKGYKPKEKGAGPGEKHMSVIFISDRERKKRVQRRGEGKKWKDRIYTKIWVWRINGTPKVLHSLLCNEWFIGILVVEYWYWYTPYSLPWYAPKCTIRQRG